MRFNSSYRPVCRVYLPFFAMWAMVTGNCISIGAQPAYAHADFQ